ncbi:protein of unknown function [Tangfeifania diversioriginum]|uniref:DUF4252 domain-containing protein n=1 Tax=Tangfeifania diversioriginum TaxID=1168035 RepID=A0A1M6LS35_9BACT|nr:DUF4252 domain-containing protein [Tangfeifania diversioriginum]SHJ74034.1 protein of unknown function [Tangfeifania diversioriginum]
MDFITKVIFIIGFLLASLLLSAQSKSDKIYDTFSGKEGVTNFSFNKNMIDAVDIDLNDENQHVSGDLHEIRFLSYNPEKGELSGPEFLEKAIALLPSSYKKYEDPEDDDSDAEIWLRGRGKKYSECHVFIKNEDPEGNRFVISFYGDFNVDDLDGLKKVGKDFSEK